MNLFQMNKSELEAFKNENIEPNSNGAFGVPENV